MTVSRFLNPPRALASCVFAAIYRDTRGANLASPDRINHFPASPLVAVTAIRHGQLKLLGKSGLPLDPDSLAPLADVSVTAPSTMPIASWSPGDVEAITVGIFPDAWVLLQGAPDFSSPPDIIFRAMTALRDKRTADEGWTAFCALLEPIWRKHQDESWKPARHLSDWARSVMVRAARSSRGESLRTFERHLKRLSGQTKRTLDFYTTFEGLHRIATTEANGTPADIAAMAGYSDQSHMGRSVRRATGFSPAALNHAIQTEEAFWCYRLLGQRF